MKPLVVSALALGALSAAAFAEEPITLTDAQMDVVTAGKKGVSVSQKSFADLTIGLDGSDKGSASVSLSVELTDSIDTEVTEQGVIVKIGKRLDSDLPPGGSASLWSEVKVTAQPGQTVRMVKSNPDYSREGLRLGWGTASHWSRRELSGAPAASARSLMNNPG